MRDSTDPGRGSETAGSSRPLLTILVLLFLALSLPAASPSAASAAPEVPETRAIQGEAMDFDGCVRLALRQSPYLTKSALEIDVRRLDEADSRFGLLPNLTFRTRYYINRPEVRDLNPHPYSLEFVTDSYNPVEAYFSIQARKLITRIAVLSHLKVISEGIQRLGKSFLELEALRQAAALQDQAIELSRKHLGFLQKRQELGEVTSLEVKVASQEVELAQAEKSRLNAAQHRLRENIKAFLGLPPDQNFAPDLRQVRQQVLRNFDPVTASLEQAKSRSHEMKMQALKQELQTWNITLAKAKLLPTIFFGVQTPDPLSLVDASGMYFSVGVNVPVWDGLSRYRNISRQRTILRQYASEGDVLAVEVGDRWREALERVRSTADLAKLAQSQEELAQLRERQGQIRYESGGETFSVSLEGSLKYLEARKNTALKKAEHDTAVLSVRHLSGDLVHSYVDAGSFQP